jgi:23S rRNA pseudouridine1911/1915/1917 synthase
MSARRQHPHQVAVAPDEAGRRLDKFLTDHLPQMSRVAVQSLIRSGHVKEARGAIIKDTAHRVKPAEAYRILIPEPKPAEPAPEEMALDIAYEDASLVVIDKPAHLVVHPAAGHSSGTLVNALIAHCGDSLSGIGGVKRPGIVHRLDKGTSGLLVVAKTDAAHAGLAGQFAAHGADGLLERAYLALVWGRPLRPRGTIEARLARSQTNRTKIAVVKGGAGRHAVTHYEVLKTLTPRGGASISLLRLRLETGRTHQIRVHLAHIGHPVVGDSVYGSGFKVKAETLPEPARGRVAALKRQALHAAELAFQHPKTGKKLRFQSPLPDDFAAVIEALEPTH